MVNIIKLTEKMHHRRKRSVEKRHQRNLACRQVRNIANVQYLTARYFYVAYFSTELEPLWGSVDYDN